MGYDVRNLQAKTRFSLNKMQIPNLDSNIYYSRILSLEREQTYIVCSI